VKTPLPRKLTFADPDTVRELAKRGEAMGTSEMRQMVEYAIDVGGIYLKLTPKQYARLKRPQNVPGTIPLCVSSGALVVLRKIAVVHYESMEFEVTHIPYEQW
jgi:hypothetical protein